VVIMTTRQTVGPGKPGIYGKELVAAS